VQIKRKTCNVPQPQTRVQKNLGFLKKAQPSGFYWFFFGQAGKIGKIKQKLSNLKP